MYEAELVGDTWLVPAIGVTFLCCAPFGIAGIVYAVKCQGRMDDGEYVKALHYKIRARAWTITGFAVNAVLAFINYAVGLDRIAGAL